MANNGWKGKHHSAATRAKISASLKARGGGTSEAVRTLDRRSRALAQIANAARQHGSLAASIAHDPRTAKTLSSPRMTANKQKLIQDLGIGMKVKGGVVTGRVRGPLNSLGREAHARANQFGREFTKQANSPGGTFSFPKYVKGTQAARRSALADHAAAGRARVAGRKQHA